MSFELIVRAIPWIFIACMCLAFYVVVRHINDLRKKNLEDEVSLGEKEIDDKFRIISDVDLINELNKRDVPSIDPPESK